MILRPTLGEPAEEDDAYDRLMTQPSELEAAGVKFAFGSFDNSFARRLGQQAANAVAHGLAYEDGLKAVTLYPAQIFGLDGQLGTVETGKVASLIVTTGDPLEVTTEVKYLFIKGQLTSTDNRHKDLYEKYASRPKTASLESGRSGPRYKTCRETCGNLEMLAHPGCEATFAQRLRIYNVYDYAPTNRRTHHLCIHTVACPSLACAGRAENHRSIQEGGGRQQDARSFADTFAGWNHPSRRGRETRHLHLQGEATKPLLRRDSQGRQNAD